MEKEEIKYYLDDDGGLWKRINFKDYFFSRKKQKWINPFYVFFLPVWDYKNKITEEQASIVLSDYQKEGVWEEEPVPIRYYSNDNDSVYAIDVYDNEYYVLADMTLKPVAKGSIDCMWGGLSKEEAKSFVEKEYNEEKWILTGSGSKLIRIIGDYEGRIWLEDNQDTQQKKDKVYHSEVIHDDGMDVPAKVAFFESDSLDELKKITESRMKRGAGIKE